LDSTNQRIVVRARTTVALRCKASGNPSPEITWKKKNDRLPAGDISGEISKESSKLSPKLNAEVIVTDSGTTYSMNDVNRHHTGSYECEANNGVGPSVKAEIKLQVLCKL